MNALNKTLDGARPMLLTATRVILGIVFFWHGLSKFRNGMGGVQDMFTMWEIPAPGLAAWFVAIVELVGGIALILGLGTRLAAILLALVMVGALIFVKAEMGITGGANTDLGLLAALLAVLGYGPGPFSADRAMSLDTGSASA